MNTNPKKAWREFREFSRRFLNSWEFVKFASQLFVFIRVHSLSNHGGKISTISASGRCFKSVNVLRLP